MPRRRVRAITATACSVALLAAGTAGASPASARAQDHQRLAPRTHFVMAPDGSSGERAQGAAIPNIDSVKKTIRAYYGAGDAGTANPTTSPYISEMRSIVAQQGRYLDRAKQAAKRHHQRPAIVFDADDTTLWTYDMEDAAMHFNFDSALQNTWVQEQRFPATPSMVEFVNRAARMGFAIFGITGRTDTQEEATVANLAKVGYTPFNAENFYTKWSGTNPQPKLRHLRRQVHHRRVQGRHPQAHREGPRLRHRAQRRRPVVRPPGRVRRQGAQAAQPDVQPAEPGPRRHPGGPGLARRAPGSRCSPTARAGPPRVARASPTSTS